DEGRSDNGHDQDCGETRGHILRADSIIRASRLRMLKFGLAMAVSTDRSVSGAGPSDEGLVRALGLGSAVLFVMGSVIGSGIFLTTGTMAEALPSPALLLVVWLSGGVIALTGGLTYAELG